MRGRGLSLAPLGHVTSGRDPIGPHKMDSCQSGKMAIGETWGENEFSVCFVKKFPGTTTFMLAQSHNAGTQPYCEAQSEAQTDKAEH